MVYGDTWTAPLKQLLKLKDTKETFKKVYGNPRDSMTQIILFPDHNNTPLEIAYRWTLACKSAKSNNLTFDGNIFNITCGDVLSGRIFDGDEPTHINDSLVEKKVEKNILFYVKEGESYKYHPLFNLFFLCEHQMKDTLVVIDVTGGGIKTAEEKLERISKWIGEQKLENLLLRVSCLRLVPRWKNKKVLNAVIIGQDEACNHLGGLQQMSRGLMKMTKNSFRTF